VALHHVVVMGVSGTGKTTVGQAISDVTGAELLEGDDFHPQANIDKMSAGIPLDDEDRRPWLRALAAEIARLETRGRSSVTACSALRRVYRDWLREGYPELFFVHLHAPYEVLLERMRRRTDHFMPPSLLQSQFDTLELLQPDEAGVVIDDSRGVEAVISDALAAVRGAGMAS
jgi:gluconokinase